MKIKSKAILLVLSAVLLVAASVFGTLAYLTSEDSVKNTFTVGNVQITLDETDIDSDDIATDNVKYIKNGDGVYVKDENGSIVRDKANAYHLLPGETYDKDPIVHVIADSENSYIFIKVVNNITGIEDNSNTIASQISTNGWTQLVDESNANVAGVFYKEYTKSEDPVDYVVFKNFTIDGDVENAALANYEGKTIEITAYAIQKSGFEDNVYTAWETVSTAAAND